MTLPDHFDGEDVIIVLERDGSSVITNFEGKVLSWNVSGGAQPTEDVFTFGGRTFNFQKPREKFNVEFEVVINDSDLDFVQFGSGTSGAEFGSMVGKVVSSADTTSLWRIIMYFQDSAEHQKNTAQTIIVPSKTASCYRMIFCDCKSVTFDKEFSAEDYMKGTLTLEFSATDSDVFANYFQEEGTGIGTATTVTLASLTTTAGKGLLRKAKGWHSWNASAPSWESSSGTTTTRSYRYTA